MHRVRRFVALGATALAVASAIGVPGAGADGAGSHSEHAQHAKSKAAKAKAAKAKAKRRSARHGAGAAGRMGVDDKGLSLLSNGHHDTMTTEQPLTPAERTALSGQIEATIATAKRFPTVAAALAAGYVQTGPYMPGIGAHFIRISGQGLNADGVMDAADLADPLAIVYAGTEPTASIAGFMYYSMSADEPEGFAGANDVWHYHESLCLKYGGAKGIEAPYGLDRSATPKQCASVGGQIMKQSQWMVHVWSVPGWESRQGLFGEVNPALMCPDGSYYQYPPSKWKDHQDNVCTSAD